MSECIKLSPNGLKLYKHNLERQGQHKNYSANGQITIRNRKTKEIVATFATKEAREAFYYDLEDLNPERIFTYLRYGIEVEPGTTVGNLLETIERYEDLEELVATLFPSYNAESENPPSPRITILTEADVTDEFKFVNTFAMQPGTTIGKESEILLPNRLIVFDEDDKTKAYNYQPSFFELLEACFSYHNYEPLIFTKNGLPEDKNPIACLLSPITVEEDVVLGDIFNYLEQNPELLRFIGMYSWCGAIEDFHRQAKEEYDENDQAELWHLNITKNFELHMAKDWQSYVGLDFSATGEISEQSKQFQEDLPVEEQKDHEEWSVSLTHMARLVNLPIHLPEMMDIVIYKPASYESFKEKQCKATYTLLDVLDCIYDDISFYGAPERKEAWKEELNARTDEAKRRLEAGEEIGRPLNFEELDEDEE